MALYRKSLLIPENVKKGTRELVKLDNHVLEMNVGAGEGFFVVPLK